MRVSSFAVARPAYYDRNATSSLGTYNNQIAPHTQTTRVTVTVAAGKKLLLELGNINFYRASVATVAGQVFIQHAVTSGATTVQLITASYFGNTTNDQTRIAFSGSVTIYAGELYFIDTLDSSTGGTVNFSLNYKGTSFDA